jgi:hypothetical protein
MKRSPITCKEKYGIRGTRMNDDDDDEDDAVDSDNGNDDKEDDQTMVMALSVGWQCKGRLVTWRQFFNIH